MENERACVKEIRKLIDKLDHEPESFFENIFNSKKFNSTNKKTIQIKKKNEKDKKESRKKIVENQNRRLENRCNENSISWLLIAGFDQQNAFLKGGGFIAWLLIVRFDYLEIPRYVCFSFPVFGNFWIVSVGFEVKSIQMKFFCQFRLDFRIEFPKGFLGSLVRIFVIR